MSNESKIAGSPGVPNMVEPAPELRPGQSHEAFPICAIAPNPNQPRQDEESFGDLDGLADSIRQSGVIHPLVVSRVGTPMPDSPEDVRPYRIIAGERRWRAAQIAGRAFVPVICRASDPHEAAEIALAENIHRRDLNPIELANAINTIMRSRSLSQAETCAVVAMDRDRLSRALGVLDLPPLAMDLVRHRKLSAAHAHELLPLKSRDTLDAIAAAAAAGAWSKNQVRTAVRNARAFPASAQRALADSLAAKLMSEQALAGSGKPGTASVPTRDGAGHVLEALSRVELAPIQVTRLTALAHDQQRFDRALTEVAESLVARHAPPTTPGPAPRKATKATTNRGTSDPNVLDLERSLSERLATEVRVQSPVASTGKKSPPRPGSLVITFWDLDQLDGLLEVINRGAGGGSEH